MISSNLCIRHLADFLELEPEQNSTSKSWPKFIVKILTEIHPQNLDQNLALKSWQNLSYLIWTTFQQLVWFCKRSLVAKTTLGAKWIAEDSVSTTTSQMKWLAATRASLRARVTIVESQHGNIVTERQGKAVIGLGSDKNILQIEIKLCFLSLLRLALQNDKLVSSVTSILRFWFRLPHPPHLDIMRYDWGLFNCTLWKDLHMRYTLKQKTTTSTTISSLLLGAIVLIGMKYEL